MNPYKILGVERTATYEEIRTAYLSLAKLFHPDRPHGNAALFQEICAAYELLSDEQARAAWDQPDPEPSPQDLTTLGLRMVDAASHFATALLSQRQKAKKRSEKRERKAQGSK